VPLSPVLRIETVTGMMIGMNAAGIAMTAVIGIAVTGIAAELLMDMNVPTMRDHLLAITASNLKR
jgi:hypothetical protein